MRDIIGNKDKVNQLNRLNNDTNYMGVELLILGTFLTAWSRWRRKPLLLNKKNIYYYKKFFL